MKKFLVLALICALMGVFVGCMPTTDKMDKQGKQAAAQLGQIANTLTN